MVNELVHKYLNHGHRHWVTLGLTALVTALLVLPAWDASVLAKTDRMNLEADLAEMQEAISNVDRLRRSFQHVSEESNEVTEMIGAEEATRIREEITRIAQQLNCQVRRVALGDPVSRPWAGLQDDPFKTTTVRGKFDAKSTLETRQLNVSVVGSLAQLSKLTIAISRLDRFAAPTDMILQRERVNGHLRLDVTLSLFNLTENRD